MRCKFPVRIRYAGLAGLFLVLGCGQESEVSVPDTRGNVTDQRIIDAVVAEPGSWLTYGQTYKEQRFSALTQINKSNLDRLGLVWSLPIGGSTERMQGTPLVVDGVMYATSGWGVVYALNAATGDRP